ncbi:MAG: Branched-chain amino acid transporter, amino acid-binding protein [Pedosphaera sp.]|nr:Branched-chain amino acid transporter, amino acid-binding protein [Pedosphaera sp.]
MTGGLNIPRQSAAATLLRNGQVLVAGGFGNQSFLQSAELYDPAAGGWTLTDSMHSVRWEAATTLIPNGNVLVAGGSTGGSLLGIRGAELYDPTNRSWTVTGSMINERCAFTVTLLPNGKVLAAGGFGTNGALATAELYDPATGVWTPTGSLQTPRGSHTATLLPNGRVLVAGGTDFTAAGGTPIDPTRSSAEIYDPATGIWTPTAAMSQPRQVHTATLLPNGKVLVAGGVSYFGGVFPTSAELYDPVAGKWSPTFPLVSGRQDHTAALLPNGQVLVAGGFNNTDTGPTAELFDPASVVATPALLTQPTKLQTGAFQFTFRNTPGLSFSVLSTANLVAPARDWINLGAAAEVSPGHYQFTEAIAASPQRFYRVRSP